MTSFAHHQTIRPTHAQQALQHTPYISHRTASKQEGEQAFSNSLPVDHHHHHSLPLFLGHQQTERDLAARFDSPSSKNAANQIGRNTPPSKYLLSLNTTHTGGTYSVTGWVLDSRALTAYAFPNFTFYTFLPIRTSIRGY